MRAWPCGIMTGSCGCCAPTIPAKRICSSSSAPPRARRASWTTAARTACPAWDRTAPRCSGWRPRTRSTGCSPTSMSSGRCSRRPYRNRRLPLRWARYICPRSSPTRCGNCSKQYHLYSIRCWSSTASCCTAACMRKRSTPAISSGWLPPWSLGLPARWRKTSTPGGVPTPLSRNSSALWRKAT